ncbi:MAG TPA: thioesterase family protein, partial [Nannocystaceae bacterium]|nr:thioesterase family protein [Nannocystaceae bacterium]
RGGPRLLALVVPDPAATPASRATTSPASSTAPPDLLRLRLPDGRVEERRRLVASFEDANALAGRVGLARVARWMGRARELAFGPVAHHLVADLAAGRFGLVTNDTRITLQGPATALDRIESRLWLDSFADPGGEIGFAFVRIADDGSEHPVAVGRQRFTWVRITGHGAVAAEPMPPALRAFFEELRAGADAPRPALALPVDDRGPLPVADVARPVAAERFATTREQSNLVGNIYWANYFTWASAALDALVHAHAAAPGLGEATITALAIEHTREAMPHDRVRVTLVARALHLRGATFDVHFFREAARGEPLARLAAGRMEVLWSAQAPQGPAAAPWPAELRRHLAAPPDLQDTAS